MSAVPGNIQPAPTAAELAKLMAKCQTTSNGCYGEVRTLRIPTPKPAGGSGHEVRAWDGVSRGSPAEEYLKKARGGLDAVRGDTLHFQQAASVQEAAILQAEGAVIGKVVGVAAKALAPVVKPIAAEITALLEVAKFRIATTFEGQAAKAARAKAASSGDGLVILKAPKPPPDGYKTYKTHGIFENPLDSPEGRSMVKNLERQGYSQQEALDKTRELMKSGSTYPLANPLDKGDTLYKVMPEGQMPGDKSAFWATRKDIASLRGLDRDGIANRLGVPLESQQAARYDIVEITAQRPTIVHHSQIAPTTQNGWSQTAGGSQTLVTDRGSFTAPVVVGKLP